jgi:lipopolysaccharide transport system ATP-binding protein
MSDRFAISVEGLTKRYQLGQIDASTLREALANGGQRLMGAVRNGHKGEPRRDERRDFWALKGVSLDIEHGEIVGVVGNNGAGKSTLLKILSRITPPTGGSVRFRGRIGSLLEVGTGFHPELSGRDNIFLNGAILGMRRHEIAKHFDEIVAFAETEAFIDTPVKRYSSGMYLRLAFAVAAHLDTDILLVDEVLAVGDVAFQKKCMARMSEVAHTGRTVLFVSHNLTAVQALCHRTIWLHEGVVAGDGETREVLSRYLRASSGFGSSTDREWPAGEGPSANGIELRRAAVYPVGGQSGDPIDVKTNFRIEFQFAAGASTASTHLGLQLVNEQGTLIFDIGPGVQPAPWTKGLHMFQCDIPAELFNDGAYRFGLTLYQDSEKALELPEILSLDILDSEVGRNGWFGKWPGLLRPRFSWKVSSAAAP